MNSIVVWLKNDLRIEDNQALFSASKQGKPVYAIYVWAPDDDGMWAMGGASRCWLHFSLQVMAEELVKLNIPLIIRSGPLQNTLYQFLQEVNAEGVFWNRQYEPFAFHRDLQLKGILQKKGLKVETFKGNLLFEPWEIANQQKKPFQVFTPFWKNCLLKGVDDACTPTPATQPEFPKKISSLKIDELNLLPRIHWDKGIKNHWKFGCIEAIAKVKSFIKNGVDHYSENRDYPAVAGVSELSPYLHFGEITPRMIWKMVLAETDSKTSEMRAPFLRQLGWREFAHHLLFHFPHTPEQPLRKEFASFPWLEDKKNLKAWQKGLTGYPIVDAGMRQLWETGWMHNRVRMIVGSFLVKDLLLPWLEGAKWFWDTLVDADLANNTLGWQWVGGCGADAAPYFRIFNPVTQGEKFDPNGEYVKKWVPELAGLSNEWIHHPWEAPGLILRQAGIVLGKDYPWPIVDHGKARERALQVLASLKEK